jgi:hypothetical protein
MHTLRNYPLLVFVLSLALLWLSAQAGVFFRRRLRPVEEDEWKDLDTVLAATLTLTGLIVAFSFSMAIARYDQRKHYEAEEANAIGTEYVRADLLPSPDADKVHALLREYLQQRVLFYETGDSRERQILQIDEKTARLESELWSGVRDVAGKQPTPIMALTVWGMNDVLNARGYTQAEWLNRIPVAAWSLMVSIAIFCNFLVGYSAHKTSVLLFLVLPLSLAIAFFLIADIDSPHGGLIRVLPQNLVSLSESVSTTR